jgi:oligopeptide transport system permease protein
VVAFLLKRAAWFVVTLWVVYTVSFILMRLVPGGPFDREKKIPEVIKRRIEAQFLLDRPIHEQYAADLWNKLRLDFGPSYQLEDYLVVEVIAEGLPISVSLGILGMFFAIALGLTAGVVSAVRRHGWLDTLFMVAATLGIAVPNFVVASVCILLFVFWLEWFPAAGWGTLRQLVLPAICLGLPFAAYIARLTRTSMLEVLGQDYVRTAFAKGLGERRVVVRHALRGAILPVVSYLGPATAGILTGSLVLERIFSIPGIGSHFIEAANQKDYTLAMGMVLVYTVLLFVMNTLVDLSYAFIDPRVKLK